MARVDLARGKTRREVGVALTIFHMGVGARFRRHRFLFRAELCDIDCSQVSGEPLEPSFALRAGFCSHISWGCSIDLALVTVRQMCPRKAILGVA